MPDAPLFDIPPANGTARNGSHPSQRRPKSKKAKPVADFRFIKRGRPAPGGFIPRPRDENLGGAKFWATPPFHDSPRRLKRVVRALAPYQKQYRAQIEPVIQHFLDAAYATRIFKHQERTYRHRLERKQAQALRAAAQYPANIVVLQEQQQQATAEPRVRLATMDEQLRVLHVRVSQVTSPYRPDQVAYDVTQPEAALQGWEDYRPYQEGSVSTPSEPDEPASLSIPRIDEADYDHPLMLWFAEGALGCILGIAIGCDQQFLNKSRLLAGDPGARLMAFVFAIVGFAMIVLITTAIARLWEYAAENVADVKQASATPSENMRADKWATIRPCLAPTGLTSLIVLVETAILRNARVASILIQDKQNLTYYLSSAPFVLPACLQAATLGWKRGLNACRSKMAGEALSPAIEERSPETPLQEAQTPEQETASWKKERQSALHQAQTLIAEVQVLTATRSQIVADIEEISRPYTLVMSQLTKELDYPHDLSEEEKRLLDQLRLDAESANKVAQLHLQELVSRLELLDRTSAEGQATGSVTVLKKQPSGSPARFYARLVSSVRRLFHGKKR